MGDAAGDAKMYRCGNAKMRDSENENFSAPHVRRISPQRPPLKAACLFRCVRRPEQSGISTAEYGNNDARRKSAALSPIFGDRYA
jgi:hypothetical protein